MCVLLRLYICVCLYVYKGYLCISMYKRGIYGCISNITCLFSSCPIILICVCAPETLNTHTHTHVYSECLLLLLVVSDTSVEEWASPLCIALQHVKRHTYIDTHTSLHPCTRMVKSSFKLRWSKGRCELSGHTYASTYTHTHTYPHEDGQIVY